MYDADGFYIVRDIAGECIPDSGGIGAVPPVRRNDLRIDAKTSGNLLPQEGKMAGLAHQYLVTCRQGIDQRRFPGAATGCGVDDYRLFGFEYRLESGQNLLAQGGKAGSAMIDNRLGDGAQHAVRDVGRSRNLQEMPAARVTHAQSCQCAPIQDSKGTLDTSWWPYNSVMEVVQARLRSELEGEVLFDEFSLGRYSSDASIYQIKPLGITIPTSSDDAIRALEIATDAGLAVLPRGAGTSQCGQAVGEALIIDNSKYLRKILDFNAAEESVWVEPGVVLDSLNAFLKPHGLCFPVDVSTSAQATIGGMMANNSCGARSIRYGNMVHNVLAADAWLTSGDILEFAAVGEQAEGPEPYRRLVDRVRELYANERDEIAARVPDVQRRVAGYNLDMAATGPFNMVHLLVGSEGTLAYFRRIKLKLSPLPPHKVLGIVHFPTFHKAMELTQHIVKLEPSAVELVDRTMIELSRENPVFRQTVDSIVHGKPDAILLVEFAGDDKADQQRGLGRLVELLGDLGLPDSVVEIEDATLQNAVWNVRKAGLNIMMSMQGNGKPVSFIEDCAVPLEHLAEYTDRLTQVFEKHGTRGTWYAHASVGCLHVRPVLDMRSADGAKKMRAIAEEACELVRQYKGSYSGEHGDGLVRSEWIERVYGSRLANAFVELKRAFDPKGLMNPGKIVAPTKMDDRTLFRFKPGYSTLPIKSGLDWSGYEVGDENRDRGFAAAIEMCNNNGHCRKFDAGTMCPSYRVTRNERDLTRGRANSLRLAMSGQLGPDALFSDDMYRTMELCVSCKGCKRECPTGVDMAAMKIEFLYQYHQRHPRTIKDSSSHTCRVTRRYLHGFQCLQTCVIKFPDSPP